MACGLTIARENLIELGFRERDGALFVERIENSVDVDAIAFKATFGDRFAWLGFLLNNFI